MPTSAATVMRVVARSAAEAATSSSRPRRADDWAPKKSGSQLASRPACQLLMPPVDRVWLRLSPALLPSWGEAPAAWLSRSARAWSSRARATARSVLPCSASSIRATSSGSSNCCHQRARAGRSSAAGAAESVAEADAADAATVQAEGRASGDSEVGDVGAGLAQATSSPGSRLAGMNLARRDSAGRKAGGGDTGFGLQTAARGRSVHFVK
jgi:hypothetical protein